jgi:hypothetical protein
MIVTLLRSKYRVHKKNYLSLYFRKSLICLSVGLRIGQIFPASCKTVCWLVTTNCCFMSDIIEKLIRLLRSIQLDTHAYVIAVLYARWHISLQTCNGTASVNSACHSTRSHTERSIAWCCRTGCLSSWRCCVQMQLLRVSLPGGVSCSWSSCFV